MLERVLEWQKEAFYLHEGNYRRIFLDLPYLRSPAWQALDILPEGLASDHFKICLDFMERNKINLSKGKYLRLFGFPNPEDEKVDCDIPKSS